MRTTIAAVLVLALGCSDPGVALRGEAVLQAAGPGFPWVSVYDSVRYTISNPRWEDGDILGSHAPGYATPPGVPAGRWLTIDIHAVSESDDLVECKVPMLWWSGAKRHATPTMRVYGKRGSSYTSRTLAPGESHSGTLSWDCLDGAAQLEIKWATGPAHHFTM